jgi:hypothetical protein
MPRGIHNNHKANKGTFKKGHPQYNTGRTWIKKGDKLSKETKKKMSERLMGNKRGIGNKNRLGKHFSKETKRKMSLAKIGKYNGDKNPSWKGGITPLTKLIRHNFKNRQWISDVFTRDNFICQKCGYAEGRILNAHHIKPFSRILEDYKIKTLEEALLCEELWNINNGITLCKNCHKNFPDNWKDKLWKH